VFYTPASMKVAAVMAVLAGAGCTGDPKPVPQQVAPATAAVSPDSQESLKPKATDPAMARLDALIADTNRKESEYKEAERAASEQTNRLARQGAMASSQSIEDRYIAECRGATNNINNFEAYVKTIPEKDQSSRRSICMEVIASDLIADRLDALIANYDQIPTLTPAGQSERSNLIAERARVNEKLRLSILMHTRSRP